MDAPRGAWRMGEECQGRDCFLWCPPTVTECPVPLAVQADPLQTGFSSGLTYSKGEYT